MKTSAFSYHLPPALIAQQPVSPRDHSRLLIYKAKGKRQKAKTDLVGAGPCACPIEYRHFYDLPQYLKKSDVLVFNDTKVFPARLLGCKASGGKIEVLLLEPRDPTLKRGEAESCTSSPDFSRGLFAALLKPGKNADGQTIYFASGLTALVVSRADEVFTLRFNLSGKKLDALIDQLGQAPTPPYIKSASNLKEYQTIYAKYRGSSAAPTAGFHFTSPLLAKLKKQGIQFEYVTLHVGLGTFQPVKEKNIEQHRIHSERYSVAPATWQRLLAAKKAGRRLIAVGTTTCRVLETLAKDPRLKPGEEDNLVSSPDLSRGLNGTTDIFITPGYNFKMTDGLITNFHLPQSTLLMLVAAFISDKIGSGQAGIGLTKEIYQAAIKKKYRFYSFGDAMLII